MTLLALTVAKRGISEMSWNYRVIRKTQKNPTKGATPRILHSFDLHEVYYRKNGNPHMWTAYPVYLKGFDSAKDMQESLEMMLNDAKKHPVLEVRKVGKKDRLFVWGSK